MAVISFGSLNMDLVARSPRLPKPGETLTGHFFETIPGGKGANQAVAVARLGIPTQMVGRVGGDGFGRSLLNALQTDGVGCDSVAVDEATHSGVAMIAVDDASENHIIVVPGANGRVGESDVARLSSLLFTAQVLLLQLEVPLPAVVAAAAAAQQAGVLVILDPAPARTDLPNELYSLIDIITPNQVEAAQLVGFSVGDRPAALAAAETLQRRGVKTVVIKLGRQGALCLTAEGAFDVPSFPVQAVDTVAAGDAFNGGLAAAIAQGLALPEATRQAAAVAALSVTKAGAQPSLPSRLSLETFLAATEM
ncbi:MAG: ribokinase [Kaiparowitsia implicata GSE-PSE-MK54-09C]|jgi:ribokinase|nr:ribokinase [Kaiparowitsia implicata GSE-PSE-MK54-09C]